ncbi:MAG: pentapeptide repeat-containing protein, partial [Actinomycetota bacterium]
PYSAPPTQPLGPPPRDSRPLATGWPPLRRIALVIATLGALATAATGYVTGRGLLFASAWTFALLPLSYGIVTGMRTDGGARAARLGGSAVLAVVLGFSTVSWLVNCGSRIGPGADLAGCDLSDLDLSNLDLSGTNLEDASLAGSDLSGSNLSDANLMGTNLEGAEVAGASLQGATLARANLGGLDLDGFDLEGLDLQQAVLRRASLVGASLREANLAGADLSEADLTDATLTNAELSGVILRNTILDGAILIGVTGLTDADLASGLGVDEAGLAQVLSEKVIRLEFRDQILTALGEACRGGGVDGAAPYEVGGGFHALVVVGDGGEPSQFTDSVARSTWEPMATRFAQLVVCVGEQERETIEVCPYSINGAPAAPITRYQMHRSVRAVSAATAATVAEQTLDGSFPATCPFSAPVGQTTIEGSEIGFRAVRRFVTDAASP